MRQLVALGIIVVVFILLALAVNSCVKSGKKSALKDYSRDVTALLVESRDDVAQPLFDALGKGEGANVLQPAVNNLREIADRNAKRAEGFSPPGDDRGRDAQHDLVLAMNFRADAVRKIADRIPAALASGDNAQAAIDLIAGQMQALLASDVIISQRTKPLIDEALADAGISGAEVQAPPTVTDVTWLDPNTVGDKLAGGGSSPDTSGGTGGTVTDRSKETPASAGLHGTGVVGVTMGGAELQSDGENTVTGTAVAVQIANQGEGDESNIEVGATFTPEGGKPVFKKGRLAAIGAGETATVTIALPDTVKAGQTGTLKVDVGGVPGEQKLDNNTATYTVTIGG